MQNILSIILSLILIPSFCFAEISAQMQEKLEKTVTDEQLDKFHELQKQFEDVSKTHKNPPFAILYCVTAEVSIGAASNYSKCYQDRLFIFQEYDMSLIFGVGLEVSAGVAILAYFGDSNHMEGEYKGGGVSAAYGVGGSVQRFKKKDAEILLVGLQVGIGASRNNTQHMSMTSVRDSSTYATFELKKSK